MQLSTCCHHGVGRPQEHQAAVQATPQQVSLHFFQIFFFVAHLACFLTHFPILVPLLRHFPFLSFPHWATGLGGGGERACSNGACPKHIWYSPSPPGQASNLEFRWLAKIKGLQSFAEFAPVSLTQSAGCPSEFWYAPARVPGGHRAAQSGGGGRGGGGGGGGGGGVIGGLAGWAGGALGAALGGYGGANGGMGMVGGDGGAAWLGFGLGLGQEFGLGQGKG